MSVSLEELKAMAREWAALCAVRIIKEAEPVTVHLVKDGESIEANTFKWMFRAGESDLFEDVKGAKVYETAFMTVPQLYKNDTDQQVRDHFRLQWTVAMISLMELLTEPNRWANRILAEAAEKAGES